MKQLTHHLSNSKEKVSEAFEESPKGISAAGGIAPVKSAQC